MRKSRLLLVTTLVLLVIVVGMLSLGILRKLRLDSSSQELAIAITQSALTGNVAVLLENGSAEWLQSVSGEVLVNYTTFVVRTLGPLRTLQSISGSSSAPLFIFSTEVPTASYKLVLEFENETADAVIDFRHQDGHWQITHFIVQSDLLLD